MGLVISFVLGMFVGATMLMMICLIIAGGHGNDKE